MWKDFFYFSRGEKRGIIVLIILICITICIGIVLSVYRSKQSPTLYSDNFEEEYNRFITSLKEADSIKAQERGYFRKGNYANNQRQEIILAPFDPNTTDSVTFCQMGLPGWMSTNILKYRAKGGVFRTPEDFRKIYGLTEEQYTVLLPYIYIANEYQKKDTIRLLSKREISLTDTVRQFKYPAGTIIHLNSTDTTELKKIPGIGSAIAKRIVGYRARLGGYYQTSQLGEIGLDTTQLASWFNIENGETTQLNLNKVGIERLKAHPYFNFYQAKAVIEHRKKRGNLRNLTQLSFYDEFTAEDLERIKHYVCFE